ncbi:calcium/sodium antiporter [Candidatus Woesearchaeota archaeon]|nr:calcium/sodium antiporter [Candidatus Woesearchaeota archaeon]
MMYIHIFIFLLGLVLLVKGSDLFVKSAASIAKKLGVSEFIIGLTLVAFGTSLPELASATAASIKDASGIILGNVMGSNIANICLILGLAALFGTAKTYKEMLRRDGYILLMVTFIFLIFIADGTISRIKGVFFLLMYISYTFFLFEMGPELKYDYRDFIRYLYKFRYLMTIRSRIIAGFNNLKNKVSSREKREIKALFKAGLMKDFLMLIITCLAIILGANYLVEESIFFAYLLNIPQTLIGITVIAIGTSLPELSVAVSAVKKGFGDIAIGGVIGSNISNIALILGVSSLIRPLSVIRSTIYFTAPFLMIVSIIFVVFIRTRWKIQKKEAIALLGLYTIFMILILLGIIS